MTLANALTQIETWSVGSVTAIEYDAEERVFAEEELPVSIIRFPTTFNNAYNVVNINADEGTGNLLIEHIYLLSSLGLGIQRASDLVGVIDNYLPALLLDSNLDDELDEPIKILQIIPGTIEFGGLAYWGVVFLEQWVLHYD